MLTATFYHINGHSQKDELKKEEEEELKTNPEARRRAIINTLPEEIRVVLLENRNRDFFQDKEQIDEFTTITSSSAIRSTEEPPDYEPSDLSHVWKLTYDSAVDAQKALKQLNHAGKNVDILVYTWSYMVTKNSQNSAYGSEVFLCGRGALAIQCILGFSREP